MTIIDNCITKIFSNDANNTFSILTYLDIKKELSTEFIFNYANNIVNDNPILKKCIVKQNNNFVFKNIDNFNINNHVIIKYIKKDSFNKSIHNILNTSFEHNSFLIVYCIDKSIQESRIYFKINHSYTDGYGLINMLTKSFFKIDHIPDFKRKTNLFKSIYHYIIGTILLLIMNIKFFLKLLFNNKNNKNNDVNDNTTDFIICNPLMLDKIKKVASNNGITINDFLYSVMIKTDKLYIKKSRNIQTCSPINVSKLSSTNNMCPIFNSINNSLDNNILIQQVHDTFDNFKYSLFIPFLSFIINNCLTYINIGIMTFLYDSIIYDCDYVYSNIIGPSVTQVNELTNLNLSDIHFLTKSKGNGITFNIISSENKINIICSFSKGKIKNKKRFEKCIYKAYNSLINIDKTGFN
jgi:hypothetical protein